MFFWSHFLPAWVPASAPALPGMSAAAVISPMLITFLGMDPYMAVGIALSSDVLASAVSAYTYHKNKNLDVKNGLIMMASVLAIHGGGQLAGKPCSLSDDGRLLRVYDVPAGHQVHCPARS